MNNELQTINGDVSRRSAAHSLQALVQFLRVVRYRQTILVAAVVAAALLGGLYYATAVRLFQAKASLLVLQTGADVTNTTMTAEGVRQGLMPTYERLFSSAVVLEGAIKYLEPEDRIDLEGHPSETWPTVIRTVLSASTVRMTNIIEISYRSKSPRAAVAVVNALVRSYLEFMDKTHKGTAGELIQVFTKEKGQLEQRLVQKQEEVLLARQRFGDLGISAESNIVHPMVQRVIGLNEALIKAQQRRLEEQSGLAAIQTAVRNGEDLRQHLLVLESSVGRELVLAGLGFNEHDVVLQSKLEQGLIEDRAELRTLQEYFGPAHPRVTLVDQRIRNSEAYLADYQSRINQRLTQMQNKQLGPMLLQMTHQRLDEAWQHEAALRKSFDQARAEAVSLIGDRERLQLLEHDLKFLQDLRDVLLNKIASVDLRQDHGDIRTAVVSEPVLPKYPVWPKLSLVAVCCLVGGLGIGLGLIYVLDLLDDRFRSPEELQAQLGAPVLAMVRQMEALNAVGLEGVHTYAQPDAAVCEAFRTLRTTLAFSGRETSRLVVSSAEPGDGKTTVLANLAVSFCQSGKRTLLIDADMRRPGLSLQIGLKGQSGLSEVLSSAEIVAEVVMPQIRELCSGLDFLPAGSRRPNPAEMLSGPRLADLLAWADSRYDQVLIDSPPTLAAGDASIIGRLVDGIVLVVQPKKNRRRLVMRAAESFSSIGVNLLGIVVNRIGGDKQDTIYGYGAEHGYGYGYGYGHDANEEASTASAEGPGDDGAGTPPDGVVPRRVA
jgi:polysaccharide biosynthesis transport protein